MGRLHRARWGPAVERLLDDELDAAALDRVLAHLDDCPECLAELELMVRMQRSLARLAPVS